jgi:biotin transport system substrate-specific component
MAIAPGTTLADYLVPSRESRIVNLLRDGLLIIVFSIFAALCARVSIPLPFTPVPITLQTLAVLLTGAALGSKRGGLALLLYLVEGAVGLPVFAPVAGAPVGFLTLFSFVGGYLWAYPIAAFVVGWLCERGLDRSLLTSIVAMLPGSVIIYLLGALQLGLVLHLTVAQAFSLGVEPFIPGDLIKLVVAALLLPGTWFLVRRIRPERSEQPVRPEQAE